jgi:hypothetical protein
MPRVRALLLWLLMLALPMQGFATVTMAICAAFEPVAAVAMQSEHQAMDPGAHAGSHAATHGDDAGNDGHDAGHPCGHCGACHVTGLLDSALPGALHPLPQGRVAEHLAPMASAPPHLLDKPPRA